MTALIIIAIVVCGVLAVLDLFALLAGDVDDLVVFGPNLFGHLVSILVLSLVLGLGYV